MALALLSVALVALASAPARGQTPPERAPARRFELADYVATLAAMGTYYAIEFGLDSPRDAPWRQPVPVIDEATRALLVLGSRDARETAGLIGDYIWYGTTAYPVLLSVAGPLAQGRGLDQVWQMMMMNIQVFSVASILVRLPHKLIGRERPDAVGCREDPDYSRDCGSVNQYISFYGGHAAITITGASLACAHHQYAEPLGGGLADRMGCAGAVAASVMVVVSRMMADRHWLSDQIVSIVTGFGVGYGLPTLLYYRPFWRSRSNTSTSGAIRQAILPSVSDHYIGVSWIGAF